MVSVSVSCDGHDVSSHLGPDGGGGYLDASYAACLFEGDFARKRKQDMWLVPALQLGQRTAVYAISIDLGCSRSLHSLRVWNYNSSLEGSYRGVKRMQVRLDELVLVYLI